jgi:hypothetical protein
MLFTKMVNVFPVFAMKAYSRSRGRDPPILNLDSGWRCLVSITPWPIYLQERNPLYPLSRRLLGGGGGGLQCQASKFGGEKNFWFQRGIKSQTVKPVA